MCGINGFNFQDRQLIDKMNQTTSHRGPDDTGIFVSNGWSLGHNRLSIIDLSGAGHQPMLARRNFSEGGVSADGSLVIVFNGEVYNFLDIKKELEQKGYTFRSKTDTEVILYAYQEWGGECLQKFNGMFALAILNTQTRELFLARDRLGIKPLYYYHKNGTFIFSSEAKAILQHSIDTSLNRDALNIYFRLLYVPSPLTMWQDIYKVAPGECLFIKNDEVRKEIYWQLRSEPLIMNKDYLKQETCRLLTDSVRLQLIADRPVGVFLSGGIDSTIITGITQQLTGKAETFSVGFEQTEEAEKYNNDFLIARRTAQYFNTKHHEYVLAASDILDNLQQTIYHMDEPISNHIQTVNLLLARRATQHVKVVLGGDGGDELFGGYERYYYNALIDSLQRVPHPLRKNFITEFIFRHKADLYQKINTRPGVERYMSFLAQKENTVSSFFAPPYNQPEILPKFFAEKHFKHAEVKDFTPPSFTWRPGVGFTRQFMQADIKSWLADESLIRSDKMAMAAGLEQRVPFLDHRLVELADRIPVAYKLGRKGWRMGKSGKYYGGKVILREAMKGYLPQFVLDQPKWGWFSPAAKWVRGPLQPLMRETLSPGFCAGTKDMFDFNALQTLLNDHISKKTYALNTLWSVMTFQLWYREFINNSKQ